LIEPERRQQNFPDHHRCLTLRSPTA
jgi:hypothetical protein